jgi:hypothetical protein
VFVAGGMTYAEMRVAYEFESRNVFIGTTPAALLVSLWVGTAGSTVRVRQARPMCGGRPTLSASYAA